MLSEPKCLALHNASRTVMTSATIASVVGIWLALIRTGDVMVAQRAQARLAPALHHLMVPQPLQLALQLLVQRQSMMEVVVKFQVPHL